MTEETAEYQTLMNQGHSAAWDQDWEKAVDCYRRALDAMPDHPSALASLGLAHYQLKQFDDALRLYQRVSALQPNDPMPFEKIARIYERVGKLREAMQTFMQGGEMQLKARDIERAVDDFDNAARLDPDNQMIHTRLAMIYDKLGKKDEAVNEYIAIASLMQSAGESNKALQVVQYSVQLAPENVLARNALHMVQHNQSLPRPERRRGNTGPVRMAQIRQMEKGQEAAGVNESPTHYDPITETRLKALKEMASLLFDQNDDNSLAETNRRGMDSLLRGTGGLSMDAAERTRIQRHLSQAIELQTTARDDQAGEELENAISLGLNSSAAYFVIGLLLRKKNPQKALGYLQRSVKNPNYALGSYLLMAELAERENQLPDAAHYALQGLKLADCFTVPTEQSEELMQLYDPILEAQTRITDENDLLKLYNVINDQLMRPDWREYLSAARNQLPPQPVGSPPLPLAEMLLETNSSQVVESMIAIKQLAAAGKYRTAMDEAYHTLTFAPYYLPLHAQMGDILLSEGRISEAVEKFLVVARAYNIRGESIQAVNLLHRVAQMAPMDQGIRKTLIELLISSGDLDEAVKQYLDLANIHYLLADLDKAAHTYEEALSLSQQTSSSRQWSVQILNKLADIELQSLNWKDAVHVFEQLRNLQPQEPAPRVHLIDLHLQMGQGSAALNELDNYARLINSPENFEKGVQFFDLLMNERSTDPGIQNRMVDFYLTHDQKTKAVEKLDSLAELLLKGGDKVNSLMTIKNIIKLNPPNASDYQRLYNELSLR